MYSERISRAAILEKYKDLIPMKTVSEKYSSSSSDILSEGDFNLEGTERGKWLKD